MNCSRCGKPVTPSEESAYRNRCESCWVGGYDKPHDGPLQRIEGGADCYASAPIGESKEVTNNPRFHFGASLAFRKQRRRK